MSSGGGHDKEGTCGGPGHYILQQLEEHVLATGTAVDRGGALQHKRDIPARGRALGPPAFSLKGLAIGNGLTDPESQVRLPWPALYSSFSALRVIMFAKR